MTPRQQRVLLVGGSGMIGSAVQKEFGIDYEVHAPSSKEFDVLMPEKALQYVHSLSPDIIIYTPGYLPKNTSENELIRAYQVSTGFPVRLMPYLKKNTHVNLILFSADIVFSGRGLEPYTEEDAPSIASLYELCFIGDDALLEQIAERGYLIRLSRLFGPSGAQQLKPTNSLLNAFLRGENLSLISDVYKSYTYSIDVARCLLQMLHESRHYGIYHIANNGHASMYDFFTELTKHITTNSQLTKIASESIASPRKPKTSLLSSTKLPPLRPWQDAVAEYCRDFITVLDSYSISK